MRNLIFGNKSPNGKDLFSLALFIDALCLSKEPMLETPDIKEGKDSQFGLKKKFFNSEGVEGRVIVNGRELDRDGVYEISLYEWQTRLSSFEMPGAQGLPIWIKYYFLEPYKQGYDIQPTAHFYPYHLGVHLALNSQNWIPKMLISEFQRQRELNIEEARRLLGQNSYRVGIPYLLRIVLNESKTPEDIIKVAKSIRNSFSMRSFRNWAYRLGEKAEFDNLTDKDYLSILDAKAKVASKELGGKGDLMGILESISFSANIDPTPISLGLSIKDLIVASGKALISRLTNRHLAFVSYLNHKLDNSKDVKASVRKIWNYEMSDDDVTLYTKLAHLGEKAMQS